MRYAWQDDMSNDLSKYDGHTPGKWSIKLPDFDQAKEDYDNGEHVDDREHGLAFLSGPGWDEFASVVVVCQGDMDDTGMKNALLILDAPLLLARCRTLEADLRRAVSDRAKLRAAVTEAVEFFGDSDAENFRVVEMLRTTLADLDRPTPPAGG